MALKVGDKARHVEYGVVKVQGVKEDKDGNITAYAVMTENAKHAFDATEGELHLIESAGQPPPTAEATQEAVPAKATRGSAAKAAKAARTSETRAAKRAADRAQYAKLKARPRVSRRGK